MLLTRLAIGEGGTVSVGDLAEAVWDGATPADPTNALQTLVSRLRRALGWPEAVVPEPTGYRLAVAPEDIDVHRFRALARDGRRLLQDGHAGSAARLLAEAEGLWRGTALADLTSLVGEADSAALEEERLAAQEDRIDADLRTGRAAEVIVELEKLVAAQPVRERPVALLIDALEADGRTPDALRVYARLRRTLAEELGADPSPALQQRHAELLGGQTTATRTRTNLRAQLTSFLGRDTELAQLSELIGQSRLVTLIGPGGAGKTRLACEVGTALVPDTPNGVWLVELAAVTDPVDLAQAVVGSLGVRNAVNIEARPTARRDAFERLTDALADREAILILDNCEHLIDAAADLADRLLALCPRLRILATSREPLAITGEVLFAVPPLRHDADDPAAVLATPAVRLFADRAGAASPGLRLDETSAAAVVEICRRLDGLPLAIELAAARTRTMSVEQIAARLDDRFRLLTGGSRTALPRHRTLRAVVDWSWDLLGPAERDLAERIAVFPAGVTAASAAAAAGGAPVEETLAALVDRSLLQFLGGRHARYRMLETIREYGIDRLSERGVLGEARERHAEYFRALAVEAEPELRAAQQMEWIALVDAERENFYAALTHFADVGDANRAVQLAGALAWFLTMRGEHDVAMSWLGIALAVPGATDTIQRLTAAGAFALNQMVVQDMEKGQQSLLEVDAELAPLLGPDTPPELAMLGVMSALFTNNAEVAEQRIAWGLASGDEWTAAAMQVIRAVFAENNGDLDTVRGALAKALDTAQRLGERFLLASSLEVLGRLRQLDGDLRGAIAALTESSEITEEFGNVSDAVRAWCTIGLLYLRLGEVADARRWIEGAAAHFDTLEARFGQIPVDGARALLALHDGRLDDAVMVSTRAMRRGRELSSGGPPQLLSLSLAGWAHVQLHLPVDARDPALTETLREAVSLGRASSDMPVLAEVAKVVAELQIATGDLGVAARTLGIADRLRGSPDPTDPDVRALRERLVAELGADAVSAGYEAGHALTRDDAVAALDV
jgi:predicted ATPase/DNA-binding SARP family transcriptional activator